MKTWGTILLLGTLLSAGCIGPMAGNGDIARMAREDALKTPSAPPVEVNPADVNEKNFREMLKHLDDEITYDEKDSTR